MNRTWTALLGGLLALALTGVYWNHFDNGFYFDDVHTIVNNEYVHSLDNIVEYFTGIEAFGTMPTNRGYRPIVVLLNSVDYQLGGQALNPTVYHISIWFWYLIQGILLYVIAVRIFRFIYPNTDARFVSILTTTFYMFHTVNAETVNYIICRSDSFSTTMVLASLVIYMSPKLRRFQLHLLPFIVGMFTKEISYMFIPMVMLYHYLFVAEGEIKNVFSRKEFTKIGTTLKATAPIFIIGTGLLVLNLVYMTDTSRLSEGLAYPRWDYFSSQFVVITHYIGNFIVPLDLSADPDFKVTSDFSSYKLIGLLILGTLFIGGIAALTKRKLLPIGFGILWYFICLAPTSSLNPMHQVANDHRAFLPNIGLCIAVGWSMYLVYMKWPKLKYAILLATALVITGHGYGTYQRNEVWGSDETLWKDAADKGPNNGRALMNYGLVLMKKANYQGAEPYFQKAVELLPYWPYTHINMAILKNAVGDKKTAQFHFEQGLKYGYNNPEPYYFYAQWHLKNNQPQKAFALVQKGHEVSPKHTGLNNLLESLEKTVSKSENRLVKLQAEVASHPTSDGYINLSLELYKIKDYEGCINACNSALTINPKNAIAYNNICSAYNALENWKKAEKACLQALKVEPTFERARNNLNWSRKNLSPE